MSTVVDQTATETGGHNETEVKTMARIVVIGDSQTIRRTAETLLAKEGCEVITAADGFEALAKATDSHPDLILIDIMMPRLDGYQACALIKSNAHYAAMPVRRVSAACSGGVRRCQ